MSGAIKKWRRRQRKHVDEQNTARQVERQLLIQPPSLPAILKVKGLEVDEDIVIGGDVQLPGDTGGIVSDTNPPESSPIPDVQGGPGYLAVKWSGIVNTDPVTYEIHVSTTTDFTPGSTTLAAETPGGPTFVRRLPDGTDAGLPLLYGTTYYVKIIAKDDDGAAAASAQDSATLVQVQQGELAVNSVIAENILAGAVTAEKLEAMLALVTTLMAGVEGGGRIEFGFTEHDGINMLGIHAFSPDGMTRTFMIDAESGLVEIYGLLKWGSTSQLTRDNIIEITQQDSGWQIPTLVQTTMSRAANVSSITGSWGSQTPVSGNLLIMVLTTMDKDGVHPAAPTISGWTQLVSQAFGSGATASRSTLYYKAAGAAETDVVVALGDTVDVIIRMLEYSGVQAVVDNGHGNGSGTGTNPVTTNCPNTTQANDLWFGVIVNTVAAVDGTPTPTDPTNSYTQVASSTDFTGTNTNDFRQTIFSRNVTATGDPDFGATLASSKDWAALSTAFKAKAAAVDTPADLLLRVYAKEWGTETALFIKSDSGKVTGPIGRMSGSRALRTTAISVNSATWTAVGLPTTEEFDTDNYHSLVSLTDRFVAPFDGWYRVDTTCLFAANATGRRACGFGFNGAAAPGISDQTLIQASAANQIRPAHSGVVFMTAGQYVNAMAFQNSGGALNLDEFSMTITYIGP